MEYPKIHSLWKREGWYFEENAKNNPDLQKNRQSFIIGDYAEEEFKNIRNWLVDEKIDGTNIRIFFEWPKDAEKAHVRFGGRTSNAQIPCHLFDYLQSTFTFEKMMSVCPIEKGQYIILFGEGYGPKIQACGGNYRKNVSFILFDAYVGSWWLKRHDVIEIAKKLEIDHVPSLGIMSEDEIIAYVRSKPLSSCSQTPQMIEGVVCRSEPLMLFRNGKPIMFKLKCKEFI